MYREWIKLIITADFEIKKVALVLCSGLIAHFKDRDKIVSDIERS